MVGCCPAFGYVCSADCGAGGSSSRWKHRLVGEACGRFGAGRNESLWLGRTSVSLGGRRGGRLSSQVGGEPRGLERSCGRLSGQVGREESLYARGQVGGAPALHSAPLGEVDPSASAEVAPLRHTQVGASRRPGLSQSR